jgi:signal peptidase
MSLAPVRVPTSEPNSHLYAVTRIHGAGQRTRPAVRELIKKILVGFAGLLGVIAVLVTIAPFFGWTVVRLATGSMTPTFPTDSLLVTHTVPAADVSVGDVVMVQRPGALPITHRVIAMQPAAGGVEQLTLKGDANATKDPSPYLVRDVGLVVGGVQWGGQVFADLRSTAGLAGLTVFATLVVLWAWWPTSPKRTAAAAEWAAGQDA